MNLRGSVRSKILLIVAVPLASSLVLWAFALNLTLHSVLDARTASSISDQVSRPGDRTIAALQAERSMTQEFLATGGRNATQLHQQQATTDAAVTTFRRLTAGYATGGVGTDPVRLRVRDSLDSLDGLARVRTTVTQGGVSRTTALQAYSDIIGVLFKVLYAGTRNGDPDVERQLGALVALSQARELLSQEDALITGAIAAGSFTDTDRRYLIQIVAMLRFQLDNAANDLPVAAANQYHALLGSAPFTTLHAAEDTLTALRPGQPSPLTLDAWKTRFMPVNSQFYSFVTATYDRTTSASDAAGTLVLIRLLLAGGIGLVALAATLLLSVRVARSVVRRLRRLRDLAGELADRRLPEVVARLRAGREVDLPALGPQTSGDEISQLGAAFAKVQQTAVRSAIDEATLRRGMSEVFLNISRRSQSLLHRQLGLLDEMERTAETPEQLASLFNVDHLATRMRRYAENLVVLAGAPPNRSGQHPVAIIDAIRAAISEVEGYERIDIVKLDAVLLAGHAVADTIHLLAELMDNATSHSPPDTPVKVSAKLHPSGLVVEIEDQGPGMPLPAIEAANSTLHRPPDFDPATSARLGLFVVSRLAARHGLFIALRPSSRRGITAMVLIPPGLVERDERRGALAATPYTPGPAGLPERPTSPPVPAARDSGVPPVATPETNLRRLRSYQAGTDQARAAILRAADGRADR
ncbi:MAG TPA: nitrate- and nitrite sensing domain-containing protein [Rugosimonospora sp.]|nr:nitrate- and nitrite sensing domain-containing protein [Rugosimonospora sp.]